MTSPKDPCEPDPHEDNVPLPAEEVRKLVENFERKRSQDGELEREISLLYAVLDCARRLNDMIELPLLLRYLLEKSLKVSRAERGFLYVLIPGILDTTITLTDAGAAWEMESDGFSRSILATVLEKGRKLVFDGDDDSLHNRNSAFALGLSSAACFPLLRADDVIGAIYLHSRKDTKFGPAEIRTIGAFGDLAVAAISRALLLDEKEKARRRIEELNTELNRQLKDREEELSRAKEAFERQSSAFRPPENYGGMIGLSRAHRVCVDLLRSIEGSDIPVLISGESGTGKELAARAIHAYSGRASGPFLPINCGAMPDSLLNAELFGYRRGAFTGASSDRRGLFELSSGGILFLDEVVSMSTDMQKSLLRVLERGEVLPLGSEKPVKVDVRVIAAANTDVREMVSEGSFRQDLYYRLAVLTVELPSLRDRREDIPLLIDHFFAKYPNPNGVSITPAAVRKLQAYSWPGNIRQLENEIRRALAIGRGTLDEGFFEFATGGVTNDVLPTLKLDELERYAIERALALAEGQKVRTAELLGIPRRTLYEKLKRYGL